MTEAPIIEALRAFQAAAADLRKHAENGGFAQVTDPEEFLDLTREIEAERRALDTLDYPIVAEAEARGLAQEYSARNTATLLSLAWRLTPHEANARVKEAKALGARVTLTGELLEPLHPIAAEARGLGILSGAQTSVIL